MSAHFAAALSFSNGLSVSGGIPAFSRSAFESWNNKFVSYLDLELGITVCEVLDTVGGADVTK
jgi:hypothetical protein